MQLLSGTSLQNGRYVIKSTLGQGGFGITYRAIQSGLNREIAIKEFYMKEICTRINGTATVSLSSDSNRDLWLGFRNKFLKEARTLASLSHPSIVNIIDVFEENGTAYYAMEHISGGSLKDLVNSVGHLAEGQALFIIRQVGNALGYIHSQNILHLDIKPDNIMMRGNEPVIIDFGISKRYDVSGNQTSMMQTGRSKGYAPIEQYRQGGVASFTPATDVYSLAATLYFMLCEQRPEEPNEIYDNGLHTISGVSPSTMDAVTHGMSVRRAERPQSVSEFLGELSVAGRTADDGDEIRHVRELIDTFESQKNFKEAYNLCLANIQKGSDVEYSKEKAAELVTLMRKKTSSQSTWAVIAAIIFTIITSILYVLISQS